MLINLAMEMESTLKRVLEAFHQNEDETRRFGYSKVASELNMSPAVCKRHLTTLISCGYLRESYYKLENPLIAVNGYQIYGYTMYWMTQGGQNFLLLNEIEVIDLSFDDDLDEAEANNSNPFVVDLTQD